MRAARRIDYIDRAKQKLATAKEESPSLISQLWRGQILVPWYNLSEEQRFTVGVIALCTAIWVMWQAPGTKRLMMRSFAHDPLSGKRYTMLTSTFSHESATHILMNGMVFLSFAAPVAAALAAEDLTRTEQSGRGTVTSKYELGAFIVAAGLASALVSHVWSTRVILPRAVKALNERAPSLGSAAAARSAVESTAIRPSLGLSGSLYAMVVYQAMTTPETEVSVILLPFFSFPIGVGVFGMAILDVVGLFRGWKLFDHAAHLGGAAFGAIWYYYGGATWASMRGLFRKDRDVGVAMPPHNPYSRT
ncbi:hypothetical protein EXIGLDRAFT_112818 [Exidia glandulosa HHB12029]|uniref:Peptidase S54 rhomboid domain-containing protein n=1 Tax=Exidia glandulosa HHB12029 TaxID=1314781 RepID=A0A165NMX8_EXIGL|nr:hypothetical protein EXIGLDRAFT_112818 [Exidia glandulosa HHB12029]